MKNLEPLNIKERTKPTKDDFDFNLKSMEEWVSELPRGNVGETAKLIFSKLNELNKLLIPFQDRMNCLELLREPVQYVTNSMKKRFIGLTFPISERAWKTSVASRSIYSAMAEAYKIAAYDISNTNILFYDKKLLVTAIHRAVSYISQVLLTCYQVYESFIYDNWKDINNLYSYVEEHKLHEILIVDNMNQYIKKMSIRDEYIRSLLLFMAEPDHLNQGEVGKIYVNLERWISLVKLHTLLDCSDDNVIGKNVINLQGEFPPVNLRTFDGIDSINDYRYIDVDKLLLAVEDELKNADKKVSGTLITLKLESQSLTANLIHRLILSWGGTKKRRYSRQRIKQKVKVSIGLHNIHQLIDNTCSAKTVTSMIQEQDTNSTNAFISSAHYDSREKEDVNTSEPDVWEMVYPTNKPAFIFQHEEEIAETSASCENLCTDNSWTIINQSPEGFCMLCVNNCGENIQVGEITGINSGDSTNSLWSSVGIVRWMRSYGENGIVLGIALLSPDTHAAGITKHSDEQDNSELERALFMPEMKALQRPESLVLPAMQYRSGQIINLHIPGEGEQRIKLKNLIGNNDLVSQFTFVKKDELKKESTIPDSDVQGSEADDIWKVI